MREKEEKKWDDSYGAIVCYVEHKPLQCVPSGKSDKQLRPTARRVLMVFCLWCLCFTYVCAKMNKLKRPSSFFGFLFYLILRRKYRVLLVRISLIAWSLVVCLEWTIYNHCYCLMLLLDWRKWKLVDRHKWR